MIAHYMFSFIASSAGQIKEHQHDTYQISISIDHPNDYIVDGKPLDDIHGLVINRGIRHSCNLLGSNTVISFVYKDSLLGRHLKDMLEGRGYLVLPIKDNGHVDMLPLHYKSLPIMEQALLVKGYLLGILYANEMVCSHTFQPRVKLALDFIKAHHSGKVSAREVATAQYISPIRLQSVFKEDLGMPLGQYLLWQRIKKVITLAYNDNISLTVASAVCHFPDRSHFNHMFLKIFGVSPNAFLKRSVLIL